ncbi:hypothetical protein ACX0G9_14940 [Flavitalea flava]
MRDRTSSFMNQGNQYDSQQNGKSTYNLTRGKTRGSVGDFISFYKYRNLRTYSDQESGEQNPEDFKSVFYFYMI